MVRAPEARRTATLALLALSAGGFGIGLTEFVIAGLLSEVADDLGVSISQAGHLVGGYALAVVPGRADRHPAADEALPEVRAAGAARPLRRRQRALGVVAELRGDARGTGRGRAGPRRVLRHGAVLATSLVPPGKRASAVAAVFAGLTIANVLGVPLGAFVGQQLGWRVVFWMIAAIGVLALAGLVALLPRTAPEPHQLPLRQQFATVPGLQARVLRQTPGAATLASAANIAAFNLGNTIGVSLAGAAIAAGHGLRSPTVSGAALAVGGVALVVASRIADRRAAPRTEATA